MDVAIILSRKRTLVPSLSVILAASVAAADWTASSGDAGSGLWSSTSASSSGHWIKLGAETPALLTTANIDRLKLTSNAVVTLDVAASVGVLNLGDANGHSHAYTITGSYPLTFQGAPGKIQLNEAATSAGDTITAPVVVNGALSISNAAPGVLSLYGGISGSGSVQVTKGQVAFYSGDVPAIPLTNVPIGAVSFAVSNVDHVLVGQSLMGAGIANGTTITAISGNTITLSIPTSAALTPSTILILGRAKNTYTGGTILAGGTIIVSGIGTSSNGSVTSGPLGAGMITLAGGALWPASTGRAEFYNPIQVSGSVSLNTSANNITFDGPLSGSGTINQVGNNNAGWYLAGNNSAFAGTIITGRNAGNRVRFFAPQSGSAAARWQLDNDATDGHGLVFGTGDIYFGELSGMGVVRNDVGGSLSHPSVVTIHVGALNTNSTWSGLLQNNVSFGGGYSRDIALTKEGTGTFTIASANTYTSATKVNGGTLQIGNGSTGSIASNSPVTIAPAATLALKLASAGIFANAVANAGTVSVVGSNSVTVSGIISGTGSLNQASTGVTTLSGVNTYTGTTTVNAGTLAVTGSLCSSMVKVASGATLTLASEASLQAATLTLSGAGTVTATGGLTIGLSRTVAPTGALALNSAVTMNGGLIDLSASGASLTVGGLTISGATKLKLAAIPTGHGGLLPITAASITGTPGLITLADSSGSAISGYTVVLGSSNSLGGTSNQLYAFANAAPLATSITDVSFAATSNLVYDVSSHFSDSDHDALSYSLDSTSVAAGLSISGTGVITGFKAGHSYTVQVTATDTYGALVTSNEFVITVGTTNPPVVMNPIGTVTWNAVGAQTISLSNVFSDPDGDVLTLGVEGVLPSGITYDATTTALVGNPAAIAPGTYAVTVTADDGTNSGIATDVATIVVNAFAPTISAGAVPVGQLYGGTLALSSLGFSSTDTVDPLTYTISGPASLTNGILTFTGAGAVTVTANQSATLGTVYNAQPSSCVVTIDVGRVPLTITTVDAVKVFGGTDPSFDYAVSGLLSGDDVSTQIVNLTIDRAAGEAVGLYDLTPVFDSAPNYAVTVVPAVLSITAIPGPIVRQIWDGVPGFTVSDIPLWRTPPSATEELSDGFEVAIPRGDYHASRISAYLTPPVTGTYDLWIASDDASELWLSSDASQRKRVKLASIATWVKARDWAAGGHAQVTLRSDRSYYLEVLWKQANGPEHLSVAWTKPGDTAPEIIPPSALAPAAALGLGYAVRDVWTNAPGFTVADIPLSAPVSSQQTLTNGLEATEPIGDYYASRIRGYITAPESGDYVFWMASDDSGEFWLSTDTNPINKSRVAWVDGWTYPQQWTATNAGHAATIALKAGHEYYFEVLHKQGNGKENLAIGWTKPSDVTKTTAAEVIPASALSPWLEGTATPAGYLIRNVWFGNFTLASVPAVGTTPDTTQTLVDGFEALVPMGDLYVSRTRALVTVPATGWYTFWLASDDDGSLSLATSGSPADASVIASVTGWVSPRDYTVQASQQSVWVHLDAGQPCYLEAIQVQGNGGENLSVAWTFAGDAAVAPTTAADPSTAVVIPAGVLTPYIAIAQ
jgi:autotransporter-associated beta strand protein